MNILKMLNRVLCIVVMMSLMLSLGVKGQNYGDGELGNEEEKEAMALFDNGEYDKAVPLFEDLISVYPQNPEYNFYLGVCMVELNYRVRDAVNHLKIASSSNVDVSVHYFLARAFHLSYNFQSAIRYYKRYQESNENSGDGVNRLIEMCQNGITMINSCWLSDLIEKKVVDSEGFFRDYPIKGFVERIIPKSKTLKNSFDENSDKDVVCISEDGKYAYYSSYGKTKKNGRDLFRSARMENGDWGPPESLVVLNTPYDEIYPFLSGDGRTLYFSSQGHSSMGGFDLFSTVYNEITDTWSEPQNMGFPLNSADNDLFFATDADHEYACFASSRENGKKEFTIYKIKLNDIDEQKELINAEMLPEIAVFGIGQKQQKIDAKNSVSVNDVSQEIKLTKDKYSIDNFPDFNLPIGKDLVYHRLNDFKSNEAKYLFVEAKNDKYIADSLRMLSERMRIKLGELQKEERDEYAQRVSILEQRAKGLSKDADIKYDQVILIERKYLHEHIVGVVEIDYHTDTVVTERSLVIETGSLPSKGNGVISFEDHIFSGVVYYIQIGAFSKPPRMSYFKGVSPVLEVRSVSSTFNKYMVGGYSSFQEAEGVLAAMREIFSGAFVVAYRDGKVIKLSSAIRETDRDSQSAPPAEIKVQPEAPADSPVEGEVEFRVQVGVYSDQESEDIEKKLELFCSDTVRSITEGDHIIYTVGAFYTYEQASDLKMRLRDADLPDSFTVAFYRNQRISLEKAVDLLR